MKPELLAPGGSVEGMKAAIAAGADAVYMGGQLFGARAYADNPDQAQLLEAIDYCHLHGRRLYLTVNTLLKEKELKGQLWAYILPLYERGLDAVLVQDLGVLRFLRREFPLLPLHASTQMSVQSPEGAAWLKELGVTRIVPARELALEELRQIRRRVDVEIECFVHGSLCYCYSGQCLMSSMIGGRSGNRGRCAQPCRQAYRLGEKDRCLSEAKEPYLLSLKDICTLDALPELIEAGISSFKIEGRMKRAEYAAGVSAVYRRYIDLFLREGRDGYGIDQEDRRVLMDLYNRGGFSDGYYQSYNGKSMMAMGKTGHAGTQAAVLLGTARGISLLEAREELYAGDVLDAGEGREVVLSRGARRGFVWKQALPGRMAPGTVLTRTRCERLLERIRESSAKGPKEKIKGFFRMKAGESAILSVSGRGFSLCVTGQEPQRAQKRSTGREDIERQLNKTGDTPFCFDELEIEVQEGLFYPLPSLNALRRQALSQLEDQILASFRRERKTEPSGEEIYASRWPKEPGGPSAAGKTAKEKEETAPERCACFVSEPCQLGSVLGSPIVDDVLLDSLMWLDGKMADSWQKTCGRVKQAGKRCFLALPPVWREKARKAWKAHFPSEELLASDGLLLRCLDQVGWGKRFRQETGTDIPLWADHWLYTWNQEAMAHLREQGIGVLTIPLELNRSEILSRGGKDSYLVVYGRIPLMVTAQCLVKNTEGCRHQCACLRLTDRKKAAFLVKTHCGICTNILYNHLPLDLIVRKEELAAIGAAGLRFDFTDETAQETAQILERAEKRLSGRGEGGCALAESTRGHFQRGAE